MLPIDIDAQLYGWIRGRLRAKGLIDVSLSTDRLLSWKWTGAPSEGSVGDGGNKYFTVRPGEPVRIDVSPVDGTSSAAGPGIHDHALRVPRGKMFQIGKDVRDNVTSPKVDASAHVRLRYR